MTEHLERSAIEGAEALLPSRALHCRRASGLRKKRRLTEPFEEGRNEKKIIENVAPATVTFPASDSYIRQIYIANARCVAGAV